MENLVPAPRRLSASMKPPPRCSAPQTTDSPGPLRRHGVLGPAGNLPEAFVEANHGGGIDLETDPPGHLESELHARAAGGEVLFADVSFRLVDDVRNEDPVPASVLGRRRHPSQHPDEPAVASDVALRQLVYRRLPAADAAIAAAVHQPGDGAADEHREPETDEERPRRER